MGRCQLFECDVASDASINVFYELYLFHDLILSSDTNQNFVREVAALRNLGRIDHVILNAGILQYPNVGLICHLGLYTSLC